jgi:hypothetical protein
MAAGSSLYQIRPGTHRVRIEQRTEFDIEARVDLAIFTFDHSPVAPTAWSRIKSLY